MLDGLVTSIHAEPVPRSTIEVKVPGNLATQMISRAKEAYPRFIEADLRFIINRGGALAFNVLDGYAQAQYSTNLIGSPNTLPISTGRYLIDAFAADTGIRGDFTLESEVSDGYVSWLVKKARDPGSLVAHIVDDTVKGLEQNNLPDTLKSKDSISIMLIDDVRKDGITLNFTTPTIIGLAMEKLGIKSNLNYHAAAILAPMGWDEEIIMESLAAFFQNHPAKSHTKEVMTHLARGEYRFSAGQKEINTIEDLKRMSDEVTQKWEQIRKGMSELSPKKWGEFIDPADDLLRIYGETELLDFHNKFVTALKELGRKG